MVAVVVVLALVGAGVAYAFGRGEGDDEAAGDEAPPPSTTTVPSTTTEAPDDTVVDPPPSGDPGEADFLELVDELKSDVEDARGLPFLEPVEVELADDAEFEARLLEDFEEDVDELRDTEQIFKALDLIPADTDLVTAMRELLSVGVIGFYDPEDGVLVVRGTETSPYVQRTIVHELVHALDDQHFELDRPELEDAEDERGFGFTGLVEGNASYVEEQWVDEQPASVQREILEEEIRGSLGYDLSAIPFILIDLLVAPYEEGPHLIETLVDEGGFAAVDEAFAEPPDTSKEILEPDLYLDDFTPLPVAAPPADGEVFDEGAFGQLVLGMLLDEGGADEDAADGWAGDWYVAWADPDGTSCIRVDFAGESPSATEDISAALDDWAAGHASATVEDLSSELVRLTACG